MKNEELRDFTYLCTKIYHYEGLKMGIHRMW